MEEYVTLKDGLSIEHLYGSVRWEGPLSIRSRLKLDEVQHYLFDFEIVLHLGCSVSKIRDRGLS